MFIAETNPQSLTEYLKSFHGHPEALKTLQVISQAGPKRRTMQQEETKKY